MNTNIDTERIERAVHEILEAIGEDPNREGIKGTPARVAKMYVELMAGMSEDPKRHVQSVLVSAVRVVDVTATRLMRQKVRRMLAITR